MSLQPDHPRAPCLETRKLDLENPWGFQRPSERRGAPAATSHGADVAIGTAGHGDKLRADASGPKYASTSSVDAVRKPPQGLRRTPLATLTNSSVDSGSKSQRAAHALDAPQPACSAIDPTSSQPTGSPSKGSSQPFWDQLSSPVHTAGSQSTTSSEPLGGTMRTKRPGSPLKGQNNQTAKRPRVASPPQTSPSQAYLERQKITLTAAQDAAIAAAGSANIHVRGQAGAGKTTVAELVAVVCEKPDAPALFITPRMLLSDVTKERLGSALANIAVHSVYTLEHHLLLRLRNGEKKLPQYSIIILDGFENSTSQLRDGLREIYEALADHHPPLFILSNGRGSISTFATDSATMELGASFTVSHAHAQFVHRVYLHTKEPDWRLTSFREGSKPHFVLADLADIESLGIYFDILIKRAGADKTAILTPSVKLSSHNNPIRLLLNQLTKLGIPIFEPRECKSPRSEDLDGKVAVATYSQFQGCHCPLVFVLGTDASYFDYFGTELSQAKCPNRMYDAITRASEQLVLVNFIGRPPLPFIQSADLQKYASCIRIPSYAPQRPLDQINNPPPIPRNMAISEIARSFDNDDLLKKVVAEYLTVVELEPLLPPMEHLEPPDRVSGAHGRPEDVSDLNGIIVMEAFKSRHLNEAITVEQVTRRAINDKAERLGLTQRQKALEPNTCTWLADHLERMVDRLVAQFRPEDEVRVEKPLEKYPLQVGAFLVNLGGFVDVLATTSAGATIWEVKLVSRLSLENVIQAAIYGFVYAMQVGRQDLPRVILFNIRDGEKLEIKGQMDDVRKLIVELLSKKYLERRY
ncbi:hypothetical protein C8R46DRAFT_388296 [Mycena filopes]|nr:hypothetical protein C8R46DRAFT_388296 [Mycena filopes]